MLYIKTNFTIIHVFDLVVLCGTPTLAYKHTKNKPACSQFVK